jgi:hypothetical protein
MAHEKLAVAILFLIAAALPSDAATAGRTPWPCHRMIFGRVWWRGFGADGRLGDHGSR